MKLFVGLLLAAGVGWIVWSMLSPPVLLRISMKGGRARITGRMAQRTGAEIEEFFQSNFPHQPHVRIAVLSPTAQHRSRIRITGEVSDGEKQLIRNYLLTRV